jgi:uncharacterized RDD family membrane protein YckC
MTAMTHPSAAGLTDRAYGGFWIRLLAFMVDGLVIGALVALVTLLAFGREATQTWALPTIETAVGFVYLTTCWSFMGGGQTLGMRLFGLRVVNTDGSVIGLGAAIMRWLGIVISAALLLLGLLWIAVDPRKQGWHDKLAGTIVVRDPADGDPTGSAVASSSMTGGVAHPVARTLAVALGLLGTALAAGGALLAAQGDAVLRADNTVILVAGLAASAFAGVVLAWVRPGIAAILFVGTAVALGLAAGPLVGPWYDGLLAATTAGPAAENAYWLSAPAVAILFLSGMTLVLAGIAAVAGTGGSAEGITA